MTMLEEEEEGVLLVSEVEQVVEEDLHLMWNQSSVAQTGIHSEVD